VECFSKKRKTFEDDKKSSQHITHSDRKCKAKYKKSRRVAKDKETGDGSVEGASELYYCGCSTMWFYISILLFDTTSEYFSCLV